MLCWLKGGKQQDILISLPGIGRIHVLCVEEEIKKFVAFPRLTPVQPDAYAQPSKRASLSDPPHPSGLPTGRQKKPQSKIAALGSTK